MLAPDAHVYIAGHRGMVGSGVWRQFANHGVTHLTGHASSEVDLRDKDAAFDAITSANPDVLVLAAAKVGGILANSSEPVQFLNDNLRIQTNVFEAAHEADVQRLLFLGSSCIYPKYAPQPIPESALLTGELEPTNKAYALAKIAGIMAVQAYREQYGRRWISAMPTNLYGPRDNFDPQTSHVLPALISKFHDAVVTQNSAVTLWGTGTPLREFLHVDDLANACHMLLDHYDGAEQVNVGTGEDVSIADLANLIAQATGYSGEVQWDTSKPDGTPRKLLDIAKIQAFGFSPQVSLEDGIAATYAWYCENIAGN